ncbi:hypothetical protein SDC9_98235 [bioreactor metagenome]|uniref:Uncharacterized protein n=1 Tax=bioreactor metagenome TaxID=1076179 RepID=A0A645AEV2_9ZZZZ
MFAIRLPLGQFFVDQMENQGAKRFSRRDIAPYFAQNFFGFIIKIQTIPVARLGLKCIQLALIETLFDDPDPLSGRRQVIKDRKNIVVLNGILMVLNEVPEELQRFMLQKDIPVIAKISHHKPPFRHKIETCILPKAITVPCDFWG